jgi:hypothetical protein
MGKTCRVDKTEAEGVYKKVNTWMDNIKIDLK